MYLFAAKFLNKYNKSSHLILSITRQTDSVGLLNLVKSFSSLKQIDPEVYEIIKAEQNRQTHGLELIASEVCPHTRKIYS